MGAAHSTPAGDRNPSSNPDPLSQLARERDRVLHLDVLVDALREGLRVACLERDEAIDCLSRLVDLASVTHAHRARPINTRHTVPDSFATMTLARGKAPGAPFDDVSSSLKHPETGQVAIALLRSVARALALVRAIRRVPTNGHKVADNHVCPMKGRQLGHPGGES